MTILSDYPSSDSYLRLRRNPRHPEFSLSSHPRGSKDRCRGSTKTGVLSRPNVWYAFRFRSEDTIEGTRVREKVWDEQQVEPQTWQIDCLWTAWDSPVGAPGVWSTGRGEKLWDDLRAIDLRPLEGDESGGE